MRTKMEPRKNEINRLIGVVSAVMRSLERSVVVKKEQSLKGKLFIYRSICFLTLTNSREL